MQMVSGLVLKLVCLNWHTNTGNMLTYGDSIYTRKHNSDTRTNSRNSSSCNGLLLPLKCPPKTTLQPISPSTQFQPKLGPSLTAASEIKSLGSSLDVHSQSWTV